MVGQPDISQAGGIHKGATVPDIIFEGKPESVKARVLEIAYQSGIEPEDPLFVLLAATGSLEVLLDESPKAIKELFETKLQALHEEFLAVAEALKNYEESMMAVQRRAFVKSVEDALKQIEKQKSRQFWATLSDNWLFVVVGGAAVLGCLLLGGWGGFQLASPPELDPTGPRQLSLEEAKALDWALSTEGREAKKLWEWNRGAIAVCKANSKELKGRCAIWIKPPTKSSF